MSIYTSANAKKQVGKLAKLYERGQVSETTARNLNKVLELEVNQLQLDIRATEKDTSKFERKYKMSTTDFVRRWQAGKTDDRMDYIEWASLAQMANNLRKRLEFLSNESQK
ncbi:MAG: hypothetical protein IT314_04660 [Anaerolineales bacterium]|nr:hypothetical protein [Anaerolineales bacterium]